MTRIAIIDEAAVLENVSDSLAFEAIRGAFLALARGSTLFPVAIGRGAPDDSMVAIKSGLLAGPGLVGFKVGTYWPDNHRSGLPNHGSTTMLLDPETGYPMALVNATRLNGYRTAAANAVATDLLASPDAATLLVVGTGHQAAYELRALRAIRRFERVLVWGRSPDRARAFVASLEMPDVQVAAELQTAVREADVITTVTTATAPLLTADWVQPGTHISAMGADKAGKQELPPALLARARLYADHPEQARTIGELQHLEVERPVTGLGPALLQPAEHRYVADAITVFDSSGIALQDLAIAHALYRRLRDAGRLRFVDL